MTRILTALAVATVVLLAGCSNPSCTDDMGALTATSAPAPSPTLDANREACHQVSTVEDCGVVAHLDKGVAASVAAIAQQATNPGIARAGEKLAPVAAVADALDDPRGTPNLDVSQAWLDLAVACGSLYGDGPW